MRKDLSFLFLGLVLGALVTAGVFVGVLRSGGSTAAGGGPTVIKLAHVLDRSHPVHKGMEEMDRRLRELSGGTVELLIIPNSPLGSETECLSQVRSGALAMTKVSAASLESFVPEMAVFSLPYLFRDREHFWKVLEGPIGEELLQAGDSVGIHGLCYYDSGSRSFYTVGKPILTPEDVKGMKIRVMQSPMAMDLIRTLGGAPTPIAWGELYTALQQGMVDGAENNEPSLSTSRHYEVAKHYSLDEHTSIPDVLVMSKQAWDRLPPHVQAWVTQAARESVPYQRKVWEEQVERSMAEIKAAGVTIHRPDKAPFVEASAPMYAPFEGKPLGILAQRIREVK
ncbi:TRAP transporter substrate-binding protein [Opitutales bacterium ASA1]|uniref:TRAP transporter substrate-binding protein n=1 Tax=Congregicoccus parvus TaxID=3081749 RepID=UPI002B2C892C|nr:TRAP transporter substrate-binding protein [Opitutales bacterium ASA1]